MTSDLLFAGLRLSFSDRDGGKDWFSWDSQEINSLEKSTKPFLAILNFSSTFNEVRDFFLCRREISIFRDSVCDRYLSIQKVLLVKLLHLFVTGSQHLIEISDGFFRCHQLSVQCIQIKAVVSKRVTKVLNCWS